MPRLLLAITLCPLLLTAENQSNDKCSLPSNFQDLPTFAQDEIIAVWKNYVPGQDCKKEVVITEDILSVLEMFDKELGRADQDLLTTGSKFNFFTSNPEEALLTTLVPERTTTATPPVSPLFTSTEHSTTFSWPPETSASIHTIDTTNVPTTTFVEESSERIENQASDHSFVPDDLPPPRELPNSEVEFETIRPSTRQPIKSTTTVALVAETRAAFTSSRPSSRRVQSTTIRHVPQKSEPLNQSEDDDWTTTAYPERFAKIKINFEEYQDYEELKAEARRRTTLKSESNPKLSGDDKFFEPVESSLPFLQGASPRVQSLFKEVLNDPEVLSEGRRQEEIHLLAVSYLNARQLNDFNEWSASRRKRILAREQQLYPLSNVARDSLRNLALTSNEDERAEKIHNLDGEVRDELRAHALRLRDQHATRA